MHLHYLKAGDRAALGEAGFRMLESFISSRKESGFFPLVPTDPSRPVPMTKRAAVR